MSTTRAQVRKVIFRYDDTGNGQTIEVYRSNGILGIYPYSDRRFFAIDRNTRCTGKWSTNLFKHSIAISRDSVWYVCLDPHNVWVIREKFSDVNHDDTIVFTGNPAACAEYCAFHGIIGI